MIIRFINLLGILTSFFLVLNEVNASQSIFNKNDSVTKELQNNLREDFVCMQSSRKYIAGQKNFVIGFGNFKINFLNFDGYKKVEKFKCKFK